MPVLPLHFGAKDIRDFGRPEEPASIAVKSVQPDRCQQLSPPRQTVCQRTTEDARMSHRGAPLRALVLSLLIGGISPLAFAADITAPAKNWVLPVFTKEGFRSMTARGSEARLVDQTRFDVVDLNLTLFSGDANARVETILLSPAATFLPHDKVARGDKSVRFIGDKIEASGIHWVYLHQEKKISLDGDVRVIFSAELKNILQ